MSTQKRQRYKLGNVYAIPLPNAKFGFGRTMEDAGFAVYKHIGESEMDLPKTEDYKYIVGVYWQALRSDGWAVVENRPF
ncbi:Immunity protein 26 [Paenibacillus sp. yr247]|uniref:Imm26 family immunity protein n=1 Tax=Paenibacillus sp. yr247 TaxID=1761880 RepID=UPI00088C549B|nr:Imm26 family immunity protein [Paenibacillus sp. yr247]SDO12620.1 Immunity protein 26 [Paenibacillus sp. yr247]